MHFTMNGNCNLCYTVHTCNINVIINDFLLGIKFVISRFHCTVLYQVHVLYRGVIFSHLLLSQIVHLEVKYIKSK